MKKVTAFLEQYAEWVAVGLACVFLLYVVYAYVVTGDDLKVPVGQQSMLPEKIDPSINEGVAANLQSAMNDSSSYVDFAVPEFKKDFALAMGPDRGHMQAQYLDGVAFRQPLPNTSEVVAANPKDKIAIPNPPEVPVATSVGVTKGSSLVGVPLPAAQGAAAPAVPAKNEEKTWITVEWKFPTGTFAEAWKKLFFDAKGQPLAGLPPLQTNFLRLEVEREELVGPNQWSNSTRIQPLALEEVKDYPKEGDRPAEEDYRLWAEKNQVRIVEPSFYPVVNGDPWTLASMEAKMKAAAAADAASDPSKNAPFDPANPPANRELTPAEKQQVYIYRQKQKEEQAKQNGQQRRSQDSGRSRTPSSGGESGGGGRRRIGGYAPLPEQYAYGQEQRAPGQQYDDGGRPIARPRTDRGAGAGGTGFNRGSAPGYDRNSFQREGGRRPNYAEPGRGMNPNPTFDPNRMGGVENEALREPFDPTRLVDAGNKPVDVSMWAHDDTVTPGKTYRYRVRVLMKNPLYETQNLAKDPKLETQLAIASGWSEWTLAKAPSNTEFFFARAVQPIGGRQVTSVQVDVFRREKGDWHQGTFSIAPGDSIGQIKNKMDFTTGKTLVDIRPDVRERDFKIMVADETGNVEVKSFNSQLNDELYKSLKEKVKAAANSGTAAADGSTPTLTTR